jgi:threonine synthase
MKALRAIRESRGLCLQVTDAEILRAQADLASGEGLYVEAASAAPIAALKHLRDQVGSEDRVVCVATGSGLKEQHPTGRGTNERITPVRKTDLLDQILS